MKKYAIRLLVCLLALPSSLALATEEAFSFAVVANAFRYGPDERSLRHALAANRTDDLAFVVANGIKTEREPCSDEIYLQRKRLYDRFKGSLILTLAANDWAVCQRSNGESAAVQRLQRVREIFFSEPLEVDEGHVTVIQQSMTDKFQGYSENLRWQVGPVWFGTLNLPANNNHYLSAAGRNNEFEDRLVANQDWLRRLFELAKTSNARGIVIFSEANPLAPPSKSAAAKRRDGYAEMRRLLTTLSAEFKGKVLVIHNGKPSRGASLHRLRWRGNLGEMGMLAGWSKITVHPNHPSLFSADLQANEVRRESR